MKKLLLTLSLVLFSALTQAQSWTTQITGFSDPSRGIGEIHIVDANTVWALAFDGITTANVIQEFTKTTDGGATWTPGYIHIGDPALDIESICPVSSTTAWISALIPADGFGVIYKTIDGGATWEQQNGSAYLSSTSFLNGVHFFDTNNGLSYGDPVSGEFEVYTTSDGGDSWTAVPAASLPNPVTGEWGYNGLPIVAGNTLWFTTNKGKLYRTTDMGITWTKLNSPLTDFSGTAVNGSVHFSDNNNGFILGTTNGSATSPTYKIYTTTDGGTTWSAGVTYTGYRLMTYVPGTTTIVATGAGTSSGGTGSAYSNNNGVTWTTIDSGSQRLTPAFLNSTTGWCGGFNQDQFTDGIFKFSGNLGTESFSSNTFKVFPNPANNNVTISSNDSVADFNLKVTDLTGKVVLQKSFSGIENNLDVSALSSGAYFFTINSDKKTETIKIIKN